MLRQSSSKKNAHVAWDEENLKVNLEIQKEYSGVKIQEPKTPYRPPLPDAELGDEEMRPLELDDEAAADTAKAAVMTAFDYVMRNGGVEFTPPGPSSRRLQTTSSTASDAVDGADALVDGVGGKRGQPSTSFTSSGSEGGPESAEKKRHFEEMRKQHYDMKQALQQAKQLLASEDEEEAEEDDEADTAAYKAANGGAAPSSNDSDDQCRDVEGNEQQQQQLAASGEQEQMQQQQRTRWGEEQPADGNGVLDMDSSPDEQQAHTPR